MQNRPPSMGKIKITTPFPFSETIDTWAGLFYTCGTEGAALWLTNES
jgi:hypothetical protein